MENLREFNRNPEYVSFVNSTGGWQIVIGEIAEISHRNMLNYGKVSNWKGDRYGKRMVVNMKYITYLSENS